MPRWEAATPWWPQDSQGVKHLRKEGRVHGHMLVTEVSLWPHGLAAPGFQPLMWEPAWSRATVAASAFPRDPARRALRQSRLH